MLDVVLLEPAYQPLARLEGDLLAIEADGGDAQADADAILQERGAGRLVCLVRRLLLLGWRYLRVSVGIPIGR